jgi:pimeloyl-ACP methyl ester carboxylesterase
MKINWQNKKGIRGWILKRSKNMKNIYIEQIDKLFMLESGLEKTHTIIFLHGVCSSSNMWPDQLKALAHFHCVAPDFPGHGKSNRWEWTNINEVTEWIAEIIKKKCNGKSHIVGISLGGAVGLNLINRYPELVDKAIIDGCSAKPMKGAGLILFGVALVSPFIRTNLLIKFVSAIYEIKRGNADDNFIKDWKKVKSRSFRKCVRDANTLSLPDKVSHITSPVLFVSGEKEPEIMHRTHRIYSGLIPGSKCLYYPGKNHGWMSQDVQTHIDMCRYWFENEKVPEKLIACG